MDLPSKKFPRAGNLLLIGATTHLQTMSAGTFSHKLLRNPAVSSWGYDRNELIMGVVASCHNAANAWYVWH